MTMNSKVTAQQIRTVSTTLDELAWELETTLRDKKLPTHIVHIIGETVGKQRITAKRLRRLAHRVSPKK